MLKRIFRKRTRLEKLKWQEVENSMPRKSQTRGLYCEVLNFLFEFLYEKVSEDALREHLLEVRGHLQKTGEPVKNAINLAIKELRRLREPEFELSKIQEPSAEGIVKRYVKLNFTRFDAVLDYHQYRDYIHDVLSEEKDLVLRSSFMVPAGSKFQIFPGIDEHQLSLVRVHALVNFSESLKLNRQVDYHFIPESYANFNDILVYENESIDYPFLAIVSNIATVTSPEASRYIIYRGEEKLSKLKFLHQIWRAWRELAFDIEEIREIQKEAATIVASIRKTHPTFDENIFFQGKLAMKFRDRWKLFKEQRSRSA